MAPSRRHRSIDQAVAATLACDIGRWRLRPVRGIRTLAADPVARHRPV